MSKILLVDDKELILHSLSKTLRHGGAEVTTVTNGEDALDEIRGSSYDICFLDVELPDANGLDLMNIIGEISPTTRIIVMTAVCLNDEQLASLRSHDCYYLPKPFELDQVHSLVAEIMSERNAATSQS
jgi:DNA-binding NtrC family response regulator